MNREEWEQQIAIKEFITARKKKSTKISSETVYSRKGKKDKYTNPLQEKRRKELLMFDPKEVEIKVDYDFSVLLKEIFNKLNIEETKLLSYYYMYGYTHREIGKLLGISHSTVSLKLKNLIINIRKRLHEERNF